MQSIIMLIGVNCEKSWSDNEIYWTVPRIILHICITHKHAYIMIRESHLKHRINFSTFSTSWYKSSVKFAVSFQCSLLNKLHYLKSSCIKCRGLRTKAHNYVLIKKKDVDNTVEVLRTCTNRQKHVKCTQGWIRDKLCKAEGLFDSPLCFAVTKETRMIYLRPMYPSNQQLWN